MHKPRLWGRGLLGFHPPQADRSTFSKDLLVYAYARFFRYASVPDSVTLLFAAAALDAAALGSVLPDFGC